MAMFTESNIKYSIEGRVMIVISVKMMISATLELFTGAIAVKQERVSDSQQSRALFAGTEGHS